MSLEPALNRHKHGEAKKTSPHLHKDHHRTTNSEKTKLITNLIELAAPAWDKLFWYSFWRQIKTPKSKLNCPFPPPLPGMRLLDTVYHAHTPRLNPGEHTPRPSLRDQIVGWSPGRRAAQWPYGCSGRVPGRPACNGALRVKLKKTPGSPTVADGAKRWGILAERGPETTQFPFLPFSGAGHTAQVRAPPPHPTHTLCLAHQST